MLVLRAFRDAGRVSAGSPPSHLQAERSCETGCGQTGGGRGMGLSPFLVLSLSGFPLGAGRKGSVVGGTQRAFSSRRTGAGRRGGCSRWRRKNREPVAVVERAAAGRPGFRGGGLFPRRQRQFRSGRAKKQATKRRTKKDFPSPKRRRFVKTGFSARYKEARRSGRSRGRKSPRPGKGDRRCRLSRFAVRNSGRRCRLSRFAVEKSGRGGRLSRFAVEKSGRRGRLSHFAVRNSQRRSRRWGGPKGACNLWEPLAGDRRALSRKSPTNPGPGGIAK